MKAGLADSQLKLCIVEQLILEIFRRGKEGRQGLIREYRA